MRPINISKFVIRFVLLPALAIAAVTTAVTQTHKPTQHDKAFYLPDAVSNFVRPGLALKILSAQIAADGKVSTRFTLQDPAGLPLDVTGSTTPGAVSVSYIVATIPNGQTQYTAYTTRSATSTDGKTTTIQAGTDAGGVLTTNAPGDYTYNFNTRVPATFDKTATHTVGLYATRDLTTFGLTAYYSDATFNFVPDGSAVKTVRDVVATAACNQCHDPLSAHGGSRNVVELCILCHQPQTVDPTTGQTADMKVMVHKIHMGSSLPSVLAGGKYQFNGHNGIVDFSTVEFPLEAGLTTAPDNPVQNCQLCHIAGKTTQSDKWLTNPSRAACGSCHDNVNFATGANHVSLPQFDDNQCSQCHIPQGELEFDASIKGAHTNPIKSKDLSGVLVNLLKVDNAAPGKSPTITFEVKDKFDNFLDIKSVTRLSLVLSATSTLDYNGYTSEQVTAKPAAAVLTGANGTYAYTFAALLPTTATGTFAVGVEAYNTSYLLPGTLKQQTVRDFATNKVIYFSVDGSAPVARRTIVSVDKCNACHSTLGLHGGQRNQTEYCVMCHNANLVDSTGKVSASLQVEIHAIHRGSALTQPYKLGSSDFSKVLYPGDLRDCATCHVNGSEQLPLPATNIGVKNPIGTTPAMIPAQTAACTACHDSTATAAHAQQNTSTLGEACAVCHGTNAAYSVNQVHAR